jgi:hypothetical protein
VEEYWNERERRQRAERRERAVTSSALEGAAL